MTRVLQKSHAPMLGIGMCTRPVELDCRMESACATCAYFRTGPEFVPVLLDQRDHARKNGGSERAGLFRGIRRPASEANRLERLVRRHRDLLRIGQTAPSLRRTLRRGCDRLAPTARPRRRRFPALQHAWGPFMGAQFSRAAVLEPQSIPIISEATRCSGGRPMGQGRPHLFARLSRMTAGNASYRCSALLSSTSTRPTSLRSQESQARQGRVSRISRYCVMDQPLLGCSSGVAKTGQITRSKTPDRRPGQESNLRHAV